MPSQVASMEMVLVMRLAMPEPRPAAMIAGRPLPSPLAGGPPTMTTPPPADLSSNATPPGAMPDEAGSGASTGQGFDAAGLRAYAERWPAEADVAGEFAALLAEGMHAFVRERLAGHFTASAWLVDASGTRLLMTHHRKLDRWLQLGGHADGDTDLARTALREAEEESGLTGLSVEAEIFDLDRHWIPERGDVPGHWHYDVRYVVRTGGAEVFTVSDESHALAWREVEVLETEPGTDPSIVRMARKWRARHA